MTLVRVVVAFSCLTIVAAVSAITDCNVFKLSVPDPQTLKLKDGEHVIAAADTEHGKFEARVTAKSGVVSSPLYFIGGKLLKDFPESEVPAPTRDCVASAEKASASTGKGREIFGHSAMSWMAPVSYAPAASCLTFGSCAKASNGKFLCCAYAKCFINGGSSGSAWHCGYY